MGISTKAIEEFKKLYLEQYGEVLPDDVASEAANRLVHFMSLIYKPIKKEDEQKFLQIKKDTELKQASMPEADKIDYVRHTVRDIYYSKWRDFVSIKRGKRRTLYNEVERLTLSNGEEVQVPKISIGFKAWEGKPLTNAYGKKQLIDFGGKPLFAELAILELLKKEFWQGVWIDIKGRKYWNVFPGADKPAQLPVEQKIFLNGIIRGLGSYAGCWDLLAWQGNHHLFVISKQLKKDKIKPSQIRWLQACLQAGMSPDDLAIVEWAIVK